MAQYEVTNVPSATAGFDLRGVDRVVQNCRNLLCTRRGEIPYDRNRGFDGELYDLTINELNQALLPELERVMSWEPDAEVLFGSAELLEDGGVLIRCIIEVEDDVT